MADLPEPLVSPEVDLAGFSSFMLDVDRLLTSELVAIGTPEECWAAVLLWCRAWKQVPAASLPDDPRILAAFSGAGKRWAKIKEVALRGFVKCSDGRLYHKHLAKEANEAWGRRLAHRETDNSKTERQTRWRERVKAASEKLRSLGLTPPKGASLETLESLIRDHTKASTVDAQTSTPPSTRDDCEIGKTGQDRTGQDRTGQDKERSTAAADPEPPDLESRCRRAVGEEPCCVAQDFGAVLRLLDEPGITEADVLTGIAEGLAKAEPGFRFTRWSKFDGWIRGAARDRLGTGRRNGATPAQAAEPTIEIRGISVPESRVKAKVDHWLETGEWPEELFQRWGPPPGKMGSYIPPRFLAREPVH